MTTAMQAPAGTGPTVLSRFGARYTLDANGFINANPQDVDDLLNIGFTVAPGGAIVRNNFAATSDPFATNDGTQDYAPGSFWINTAGSRVWMCLSNAPGAAVWLLDGVVPGVGAEPPNMMTLFGAGAATFLEEGNINRQVGNPLAANTAATTDTVLAVYTLPANSFDVSGRGLAISAQGVTGATTNAKRAKLIWGATAAVVGSAVSGGVAIADTGAWTTGNSGVGWQLVTNIFKFGTPGSNTQYAQSTSVLGGTHGGITVPVFSTAVESAPIVIALTGSSYTTGAAGDVVANWLEINAMN